ncbi:hypothetical protein AMTRI_Chr07g79420 [Amborella trichopoda]
MVGWYSEEEDEESIPNFLLHPLTATPSAISNTNSHYQYIGGQRRPCSLQIHCQCQQPRLLPHKLRPLHQLLHLRQIHTCEMEGRLLYECSSNQLGQRERPGDFSEEEEEDEGRFEEDNWASVVETSGVEERDERRVENKMRSAKRTI